MPNCHLLLTQGRLQKGTVGLLCDCPVEEVPLNIAGQEVLVLRFVGEGGGDSGWSHPSWAGSEVAGVGRWVRQLLISVSLCHMCIACDYPHSRIGEEGEREKTGRLRYCR